MVPVVVPVVPPLAAAPAELPVRPELPMPELPVRPELPKLVKLPNPPELRPLRV